MILEQFWSDFEKFSAILLFHVLVGISFWFLARSVPGFFEIAESSFVLERNTPDVNKIDENPKKPTTEKNETENQKKHTCCSCDTRTPLEKSIVMSNDAETSFSDETPSLADTSTSTSEFSFENDRQLFTSDDMWHPAVNESNFFDFPAPVIQKISPSKNAARFLCKHFETGDILEQPFVLQI